MCIRDSSLIGNKPEEKAAVIGLIEEAQSRLSIKEKNELIESTKKRKSNGTSAVLTDKQISVEITLSDDFKNKALAEDIVFIYVKAVNGPPIPVAAVRKSVKDFPLKLVLNDEMAMMPNLKLSSFKLFTVGARISKHGQPIPKNGDMFSEKTNIKIGDSISLEIDQIYKK